MKLSQLIANFKILIVTDIVDEDLKTPSYLSFMSNYLTERYICDKYKSKLEVFRTNLSYKEVELIEKCFVSN